MYPRLIQHAQLAHAHPGRGGDDRGLAASDRRRPGRREVSPTLVPLMRGEAPDPGPDGPDAALFRRVDDLGPALGVARGVAVMCLVWAGLALLLL